MGGRQHAANKQENKEKGWEGEVGGKGNKTLASTTEALLAGGNHSPIKRHAWYLSVRKKSFQVLMHAIADLSSSSRFRMIAIKLVSFPLFMKAVAVTAFRKRTMAADPAGSFSTAMMTSTVDISSSIICTGDQVYSPQPNLLRQMQTCQKQIVKVFSFASLCVLCAYAAFISCTREARTVLVMIANLLACAARTLPMYTTLPKGYKTNLKNVEALSTLSGTSPARQLLMQLSHAPEQEAGRLAVAGSTLQDGTGQGPVATVTITCNPKRKLTSADTQSCCELQHCRSQTHHCMELACNHMAFKCYATADCLAHRQALELSASALM